MNLRLGSGTRGLVLGNVGARVAAMIGLGLSTILVAHIGGPSLVGVYALLRVLPGLIGVLASLGLPGAVPWFLADRDHRSDRSLRPTIVAMTALGGTIGTVAWVVLVPLLQRAFFRDLSLPVVALAGLAVFTQLLLTMGRSCAQGTDDLPGANIVFVAEEVAFLPVYAIAVLAGADGPFGLVAALIVADMAVAVPAWVRLARRRFFADWRRPSASLGRQVAGYGLRAQVGGVMTLLNLRLDFAILGAVAGPAVLGGYAIASKYAELLRMIPLGCTYVLYPAFARRSAQDAAADARRWMVRATTATVLGAIPLALAAGWVLPALYGSEFEVSVAPARILLVGLAFEGAGGVVGAYLFGRDRPGTNSLVIGAGVLVTVVLDLALIGPFGVIGAAVASSVAYLTTTILLIACFFRMADPHPIEPATAGATGLAGVELGPGGS